MEQGYSLKNALNKMTRSQKIGVVSFLVILVLALILLVLLMSNMTGPTNDEEVTEQGETTSENSTEELVIDGREYTLTKTESVGENGEIVITETKEDEYGNVTTVARDLLTSYIPYQAMRKHDDWGDTLRYALTLDEENKTINAVVEYCAEDEDKNLVQQYLESIPVDISAYTINYETFSEDAICTDSTGW